MKRRTRKYSKEEIKLKQRSSITEVMNFPQLCIGLLLANYFISYYGVVRLLAPLGTRDQQLVAVISLNATSNISTLFDALKRGGGKEIPSSNPTLVTRVTDVLQLEFAECKSSSSFTFLWCDAAAASTAVDPVMLSLDLVRAADMIVFCVGVANDAISSHTELKKTDPIDAVSFELARTNCLS